MTGLTKNRLPSLEKRHLTVRSMRLIRPKQLQNPICKLMRRPNLNRRPHPLIRKLKRRRKI